MTGMDPTTVLTILPHRHPMLLVDRVMEVVAGERIEALKNVTAGEPVFAGHFPDRPVFPGVLLIEAMAQACALLAYATDPFDRTTQALYLLGVDRARFRRVVEPGDQVIMEGTVAARSGDNWRFKAKAHVEGELVAECSLLAAITAREDV